MPQTRTISPFLAAMPGINDRSLRDIGLDADGNFLDKDDPRVPRTWERHYSIDKQPTAQMLPVAVE